LPWRFAQSNPHRERVELGHTEGRHAWPEAGTTGAASAGGRDGPDRAGMGEPNMSLESTRSFFLWCTVINYGILLLWAGLFFFAHDGLLRLWGKWARVTVEQFDLLNLGGISLYKMGVFLFNLVPCIALYIIGR
jgi:hypothetical protein